MTKQQLVQEIEAYAAARASGNTTLIQRSIAALQQALSALPDELTTPPQSNEPNAVSSVAP